MSDTLDPRPGAVADAVLVAAGYGVAAVFGYLVGSINPASIIARLRGTDLRSQGSGNPGATNAGRVMGWRIGVVVGVADLLKGYLPVLATELLLGDGQACVAGLMAVVGHITSPWLKGRGGKGVATAFGALLAVRPLWALVIGAAFLAVVLLSRNVGLASACAALALVPTAVLLPRDGYDLWFALVLSVIVLVRHQRNLRGLLTALHPGRPDDPSP